MIYIRRSFLFCLFVVTFPGLAWAFEEHELLQAIRAGNADAVRHQLEKGVDIESTDATGATPLMYSVVYADERIVSLLLKRRANVNARNKTMATPLMWAVADAQKARLLVEAGADVNAATKDGLTPLVMAAALPHSEEVVRLLIKHGADVNANSNSLSPLMAASSRGDPEIVKLLIASGANATARNQFGFSPLHGASFNGTSEIVNLLLDRGISPNVEIAGYTPAMWAAVHGKTETLKLLVTAGADPNARQDDFGTTPLLWASTTGHAETINFLVQNGADVNAKDTFGNSPLMWARRRGDRRILQLLGEVELEQADSQSQALDDHSKPPLTSAIRSSVRQSLELLQKTGPAFIANGEGCVSCHHQSLPAMAFGLARRKGFELDEDTVREQRAAVLDQLEQQREDLLQGFGVIDVLDPAFFLAGLAAEGQQRNRAIDAAVFYLLGRQQADGSWRNVQHRPPLQQSDIVNTVLGIRSLQVYGMPGRSEEIDMRIEKARQWLTAHETPLSPDGALRLLGLAWANASPIVIKKAADELIERQNNDGGWSQLPSLPSDAYATGIVLVALCEAGDVRTVDPVYQRGLSYLVETQLKDGSWFVQTRSFPVQAYFDTEFPHGRSQFISTAATAWSTMALLHASTK